MTATHTLVPAVIGALVTVLTGALKLVPGLKSQPWHNAAIRLAAAVLAVAVAAGMAYANGQLQTFDWPTVLPILGDAIAGLLAAFGLYHLADTKKAAG